MRTDVGHPHDGEVEAARFLGGTLSARAHRAFERHLLSCEACWREVELGRTGRRLVELSREMAPVDLRERLRTVVAGAQVEPVARVEHRARLGRRRRSLRTARPWRLAVASALALIVVLVVVRDVGLPHRATSQPVAIGMAVADFRAHRLPGRQLPAGQAPDLARLGLAPVGAAAGSVAGTAVTAFSYRDPAGRDVMVYLSEQPFPTAAGARRMAGPDGPWLATAQGVTVLCARSPHALLVLSLDRQLVLDTANALRVT